ncbi:protein late bloomer [Lucilia cuprina]|uniref:protein late bloomer n=1 Tax=Lucilia cuprina TaxID=7375 RepID=UPI001F05F508|nr:protein late bloomer [Lucilia cuprina]
MGVAFNTIKWFVFALNKICLFLGIGAISLNAVGFKDSQPGTDAHTFFILAILLCSLLCLTTIIGCYGVFSEVFGINVIYSIFILALLIIQYLQIRSFQPHEYYFNNLQDLESAWRLVETQPKYMDSIQLQHYCCGLFNAHDYSYKHLSIPESCYASITEADDDVLAARVHQLNNVGCLDTVWRSYKFAVHRHVLFNWALLITEFITLIYSIILSILIFKRRFQPRFENLNRAVVQEFAQQNHFGSRQLLLSN